MNTRQRILTARLTEKLAKNPDYARIIGVEISDKYPAAQTSENNRQYNISRSDFNA